MSTAEQLLDVQWVNFTLLMALHASINKDPESACYKFNVDADDMRLIRDLGPHQMQAAAANLDQCLFALRKDLLDVLRLPPGLVGVIAMVRQTHPAVQGKAEGARQTQA
jgi:hypothetical protein